MISNCLAVSDIYNKLRQNYCSADFSLKKIILLVTSYLPSFDVFSKFSILKKWE